MALRLAPSRLQEVALCGGQIAARVVQHGAVVVERGVVGPAGDGLIQGLHRRVPISRALECERKVHITLRRIRLVFDRLLQVRDGIVPMLPADAHGPARRQHRPASERIVGFAQYFGEIILGGGCFLQLPLGRPAQ